MQMLLLSAGFGASATSFNLSPSSVAARKMFRATLLYLAIFMAAMIYQRILNPNLRSRDMLSSEYSENEGVSEYQKQLVYTDLKGIEKDMEQPWPFLPPIATLFAAPFPFRPPPEDRTYRAVLRNSVFVLTMRTVAVFTGPIHDIFAISARALGANLYISRLNDGHQFHS